MNKLQQLVQDATIAFAENRRRFIASNDSPGRIFWVEEIFEVSGFVYFHAQAYYNPPWKFCKVASENLPEELERIAREHMTEVPEEEIRRLLNIGESECVLCTVGIADIHAASAMARSLR